MLTALMKNRVVIASVALCAGFLLAYLVLPRSASTPGDVDVTELLESGEIPASMLEPQDDVYVLVEHMPELVGGLNTLMEDIKYPEIAHKAGIEGKVFVGFVVNEDGTTGNVVVQKGIGAGCDEEAVRAVSEAKFTPGMQDGEPVKVRMTLPVTFKLAQT